MTPAHTSPSGRYVVHHVGSGKYRCTDTATGRGHDFDFLLEAQATAEELDALQLPVPDSTPLRTAA